MKNSNESNNNFLGGDGLVHNIYAGKQTVNTLQKAYEELKGITADLREKHTKVLVLTDIRMLKGVNMQARQFAVEIIKNVDFDKVAIFGNPVVVAQIVNFIILASGRGFKMKYFSDETEARNWLLQSS